LAVQILNYLIIPMLLMGITELLPLHLLEMKKEKTILIIKVMRSITFSLQFIFRMTSLRSLIITGL